MYLIKLENAIAEISYEISLSAFARLKHSFLDYPLL
ncbi:hypothetical protein LYNGBM3L_28110 [Moorena producens 3L]|uniref:Uncharacterized protein n=1 Tax=Moorena producens 3L TaxID=489825 RepID=F4XP50_9CYAN|nr:hypothetical protein LYNGBM3L_28110 [Moorena producens 3L]